MPDTVDPDPYCALLKHLINKTTQSLANAPDGSLRIRKRKARTEYLRRTYRSADEYIPQKNIELARKLAQKSYDRKALHLLNALSEDAKHLTCRSQSAECDPGSYAADLICGLYGLLDDLYESLPPERQTLITPVIPTTSQYVRSWLDTPYQGLAFRDDDQTAYYTSGNVRVRSKSELYIAERIDDMRLPCKYECPLTLGKYLICPDFTVLDTRIRRVKYIEHCGMMDDQDYANKCVRKINLYIRNGILPGEDLILFFETASTPLDTIAFDRILKHHFPAQLKW